MKLTFCLPLYQQKHICKKVQIKKETFKMLKKQFPTFIVEPELNYYEYELLDSAI